MKKLILMLLVFIALPIFSQEKQRESYYQDKFAEAIGGSTEIVLEDRTRVDIVTDTFTIEVDFATKWAESIGQSLHYELLTGKKAGVLLVVEGHEDDRYIERLVGVAVVHGINVWIWDWTTDTWSKVKYELTYEY